MTSTASDHVAVDDKEKTPLEKAAWELNEELYLQGFFDSWLIAVGVFETSEYTPPEEVDHLVVYVTVLKHARPHVPTVADGFPVKLQRMGKQKVRPLRK